MFKKLFSEFRIPVRFHILFWTLYFVFNFFRFASINKDYWYSLKSNLVEFPLNITPDGDDMTADDAVGMKHI